jgi:hypothetical protein
MRFCSQSFTTGSVDAWFWAEPISDIFVSYARPDQARAQSLAEDLKSRGFKVWWDTELLGSDDSSGHLHRFVGCEGGDCHLDETFVPVALC